MSDHRDLGYSARTDSTGSGRGTIHLTGSVCERVYREARCQLRFGRRRGPGRKTRTAPSISPRTIRVALYLSADDITRFNVCGKRVRYHLTLREYEQMYGARWRQWAGIGRVSSPGDMGLVKSSQRRVPRRER